MNDIAVRRIEKTILEVMERRYPLTKFDRDIRADFRAMSEAIVAATPLSSQQQGTENG